MTLFSKLNATDESGVSRNLTIRDANTYRSLSSAQATTLLDNGTYNGEEVTSGEIFTTEDGALKEFNDDVTTGGTLTETDDPSNGCFYVFKEPDEDYPNGIILWGYWGSVRYSYDRGITWSAGVSIPEGYSYGFVVRDTETQVQKFVVVIETGSTFTVTKSTDGATWSAPVTGIAHDGDWSKNISTWDTRFDPTAYVLDNKMFMFFSDSANHYYIYSADEGASWTKVDLPAMAGTGGSENRNPVVLCNNKLVLFQALGKYAIFTTTDGLNWTNTGVNFNNVDYYSSVQGAGNYAFLYNGTSGSPFYAFDVRDSNLTNLGNFTWVPQVLYTTTEETYIMMDYFNHTIYSSSEADTWDLSSPIFSNIVSLSDPYNGLGWGLSGDEFVFRSNVKTWGDYKPFNTLVNIAASHNRYLSYLNGSTSGSSAPTDDVTVGYLGQIYVDTTNKAAYVCVESDGTVPTYTWKQITS